MSVNKMAKIPERLVKTMLMRKTLSSPLQRSCGEKSIKGEDRKKEPAGIKV